MLWLVEESDLRYVAGNEHLLDEFLTMPYPTAELGARLALMRYRSAGETDDVVRRGPLALNPLSYQVRLDGRVLDLTFMEYELLKLLMGFPGRVYTREEILSLVWGYDYFGGMRTVDVHVRRVRAKLGQDHAWLIETVRGVGYRLAEVARVIRTASGRLARTWIRCEERCCGRRGTPCSASISRASGPSARPSNGSCPGRRPRTA